LEEGEVPESELAQRIFTDPRRLSEVRDFNTLSFTYTADRPSAPLHRDTDPPSKLADGVCASASTDSVQYDGDVTITCDLKRVRPVNAVRLFAFYRGGPPEANPFIVERVDVAVSTDGKSWQDVSTARPRSTTAIDVLRLRVETPARFVRLRVKKSDRCERILLGEIEIIGPPDKDAPPPPAYPSPRPLHVKKVLDDALIEAGVTFLYSCLVTDVVVDERGQPCGIVMANRAGRQAVLAKTIIDATD
ncbi:MAG TPA: FAD-dependent oxidoreductase, partial [Planctomycetaceae bacterium]|nr:FAD-dependent oxidoreductase [Planctomycetaceae bacterium]